MTEWPYPHFSVAEMACPDCGACDMHPPFMQLLEMLREVVSQPLPVTSGFRCPEHNARVGGHQNSAHLIGRAADIAADGQLQYQVAKRATALGFTGLGFGGGFIHLDTLQTPPRPNVWTYP